MKKTIILLAFISYQGLKAQTDSSLSNTFKFKLEAQTGIMTYIGELNNRQIKFTNNNIITYKAGLRVDYNNFGLLLKFSKGGYGQYQASTKNKENFRNDFIGGGLDLRYAFFKRKFFSVFAGVGGEYLKLDCKTDLFDADGNTYNYWNDGSIRNQPENYSNIFTSSQIQRDYNYETKVATKNILLFPISLGVELNLGKQINFGFVTSYLLSNDKNLNVKVEVNKREALIFNSVYVSYRIQKREKKKPTIYDNINFKDVVDIDSDSDGIKDMYDLCPDTEKGKKVNKEGCLMDADNDGIPDDRDKELNTKDGATVDMDGVTQKVRTKEEVEAESPPDPPEGEQK